jgi:hypothetical protein
MVQMFGVFVMAGGSWLVLGEEVPPAMWMALVVCVRYVVFGASSRLTSNKLPVVAG